MGQCIYNKTLIPTIDKQLINANTNTNTSINTSTNDNTLNHYLLLQLQLQSTFTILKVYQLLLAMSYL